MSWCHANTFCTFTCHLTPAPWRDMTENADTADNADKNAPFRNFSWREQGLERWWVRVILVVLPVYRHKCMPPLIDHWCGDHRDRQKYQKHLCLDQIWKISDPSISLRVSISTLQLTDIQSCEVLAGRSLFQDLQRKKVQQNILQSLMMSCFIPAAQAVW